MKWQGTSYERAGHTVDRMHAAPGPDLRSVCIHKGLGVAAGVRLGLGVPQRRVLGASNTPSLARLLPLGPSLAPSLSLALHLRPGGYTLSEGLAGTHTIRNHRNKSSH